MRGKVQANVFRGIDEKDHPRLCGEKPLFAGVFQQIQGSPPPMRGKGVSVAFAKCSFRITPAYAGKRVAKEYGLNPEKDHPRLCGEKASISNLNFPLKGSPPPMRGKEN